DIEKIFKMRNKKKKEIERQRNANGEVDMKNLENRIKGIGKKGEEKNYNNEEKAEKENKEGMIKNHDSVNKLGSEKTNGGEKMKADGMNYSEKTKIVNILKLDEESRVALIKVQA